MEGGHGDKILKQHVIKTSLFCNLTLSFSKHTSDKAGDEAVKQLHRRLLNIALMQKLEIEKLNPLTEEPNVI